MKTLKMPDKFNSSGQTYSFPCFIRVQSVAEIETTDISGHWLSTKNGQACRCSGSLAVSKVVDCGVVGSRQNFTNSRVSPPRACGYARPGEQCQTAS